MPCSYPAGATPTAPQKELLGELQLSFVLFVSLSSLGGFRHWQAVSALLCRSGDALKTDPGLFTAFIRVREAAARKTSRGCLGFPLCVGAVSLFTVRRDVAPSWIVLSVLLSCECGIFSLRTKRLVGFSHLLPRWLDLFRSGGTFVYRKRFMLHACLIYRRELPVASRSSLVPRPSPSPWNHPCCTRYRTVPYGAAPWTRFWRWADAPRPPEAGPRRLFRRGAVQGQLLGAVPVCPPPGDLRRCKESSHILDRTLSFVAGNVSALVVFPPSLLFLHRMPLVRAIDPCHALGTYAYGSKPC